MELCVALGRVRAPRDGLPGSLPAACPLSPGYTNLRSEWYTKGNDEGREEDLFWECAIEVRLSLLRRGNITGIGVIKAAPYLPLKGVGGQ